MINFMQQKCLLKRLPSLILGLCLLSLLVSCYFALQWWQASKLNFAYEQQTIVKQPLALHESQKAYSIGYLQARNRQYNAAIKSFLIAEASEHPAIRVRAKFALGNVYFDAAMHASQIATGGSHQQAVAHIELAREAYKSALRIRPDLEAARFNLELLDRLSPEKRTQGWQAETDGVTLQPFKRNGTAMMRDNKRRGLP